MGNTVANVLVGVATLAIRQPNDALAEWATEFNEGAHSVKLSKAGSGNAGSTHLQLTPRGTNADLTLTAFIAGVVDAGVEYSFYHKSKAGVSGNYVQWEFRFEDPDSESGWIEVTFVTLQTHTPSGNWTLEELVTGDKVGYGGVSDSGTPFFEWGLLDIAGLEAAAEGAGVADCELGDWVLSRIRLELWEPTPERYAYIDSVTIHDVAYEIEPGAETAPGLILSGPYTDVGYTEDGVEMEYTAEETDIDVAEETFSIGRVINKETMEIRCNMAESSLANIANAMAGGVLTSGSIITFGNGVNKTMSLRITGTSPAGYLRTITIPKANATGAVGLAFRKDEKTVVPVTFQALKPETGKVCTIVDNAV